MTGLRENAPSETSASLSRLGRPEGKLGFSRKVCARRGSALTFRPLESPGEGDGQGEGDHGCIGSPRAKPRERETESFFGGRLAGFLTWLLDRHGKPARGT
jgi:hypothetical protein